VVADLFAGLQFLPGLFCRRVLLGNVLQGDGKFTVISCFKGALILPTILPFLHISKLPFYDIFYFGTVEFSNLRNISGKILVVFCAFEA